MAIRSHALYRRYDTPPGDAAKGACYLTGSAEAGVDTGILVEFEGDLCISLNALRELCEVAGWSFNQEAEQLEADNTFLTAANISLHEQLAEALGHLEAVGLAMAHAAERGNHTPERPPDGSAG